MSKENFNVYTGNFIDYIRDSGTAKNSILREDGGVRGSFGDIGQGGSGIGGGPPIFRSGTETAAYGDGVAVHSGRVRQGMMPYWSGNYYSEGFTTSTKILPGKWTGVG
jgi:hypothetical protein